MDSQIEGFRRQHETDKKAIEDCSRERDILHRDMSKSALATSRHASFAKLKEQSKRNLEQEIEAFKDEADRQQKVLTQLLIT